MLVLIAASIPETFSAPASSSCRTAPGRHSISSSDTACQQIVCRHMVRGVAAQAGEGHPGEALSWIEVCRYGVRKAGCSQPIAEPPRSPSHGIVVR